MLYTDMTCAPRHQQCMHTSNISSTEPSAVGAKAPIVGRSAVSLHVAAHALDRSAQQRHACQGMGGAQECANLCQRAFLEH